LKFKYKKFLVLDTNIILNNAKNVYTLSDNSENLIILPETVIDELDTKKMLMEEIGFQAREFGRILKSTKVIGKEIIKNKEGNEATIVLVEGDTGLKIAIVSLKEYNLKNVDRSIENDRKIINVGLFFKNKYKKKEVTLISEDIMCRTRAISLGMDSSGIKENNDVKTTFIKTFELESELFNSIDNKNIKDIDQEYEISNYCYRFFDKEKQYYKYATINNSKIEAINETVLRKNVIKPLNEGQMFALKGLMDNYDISILEAPSGSGKNLISISAAMRLIDKGEFKKIIYIRNSIASVDSNAEIGFLPGTQTEKMKIYNHPLYDTINFIAEEMCHNKNNEIKEEQIDKKSEDLIEKYQIETQWIGELRGRTLSNAIVILDEVQNFSISTLNTVLTRISKTSKVIAIGSNSQIDNAYLSKNSNGLTKLLALANKEHEEIKLFATNLEKSVRGPITEWAEKNIKN
jgi:PhoH-like ATPase